MTQDDLDVIKRADEMTGGRITRLARAIVEFQRCDRRDPRSKVIHRQMRSLSTNEVIRDTYWERGSAVVEAYEVLKFWMCSIQRSLGAPPWKERVAEVDPDLEWESRELGWQTDCLCGKEEED